MIILAALCWRACVTLCFYLKYLKGVLLDPSQPGHNIHYFLPYKLLHDFGSVRWIGITSEYSSSAELLETGNHLLSEYFQKYQNGIHCDICISPTPFEVIQPHHLRALLSGLCIHSGQARFTLNMLDPI